MSVLDPPTLSVFRGCFQLDGDFVQLLGQAQQGSCPEVVAMALRTFRRWSIVEPLTQALAKVHCVCNLYCTTKCNIFACLSLLHL